MAPRLRHLVLCLVVWGIALNSLAGQAGIAICLGHGEHEVAAASNHDMCCSHNASPDDIRIVVQQHAEQESCPCTDVQLRLELGLASSSKDGDGLVALKLPPCWPVVEVARLQCEPVLMRPLEHRSLSPPSSAAISALRTVVLLI